jgi:hypothetical protein
VKKNSARPESANDDSPPARPERPSIDECCNSGCNPCIFDLYEEALERYDSELQAWEQRRAVKGR